MVPVLLSLSVRRHSHAQLAAIHLISSHSWLSRFFRLPHHPCPLRPRSTIRGPTPVALISIPPDAYPNTTFLGGTLQFVVKQTLSPSDCHSLFFFNDAAST